MNNKQLSSFIKKLAEKTEINEISWEGLEISEIAQVLRKVSSYSAIVGAYETFNKKQMRSSVIGKFKVRVYYEEENYTHEEYVFLAIVNPTNYLESIVFTEDELSDIDIRNINKLYRAVELEVSEVGSIIDDWFDE